MATNQLYAAKLNEPRQWRAGFSGDTPIYHDCCKCGASEPKIAGYYTKSPDADYFSIAIVNLPNGLASLALFCEKCWNNEMSNTTLGPVVYNN
jgi:hypothetical protein